MSHELLALIGFLEICAFYLLPIYLSYKMCEKRGRSVAKGVVVTLVTGWFGTLLIWLFLADHSRR